MFGVWDRACEPCGCDKTYHVEGEVNDRGEKMDDIYVETRMWANAQPDGRPAKHRWRPLFNAAKFG